MENKPKPTTAVIEVIKSYTNKLGRKISPEFPGSILRVDNARAKELIDLGVAKMLNPDGTCILAEMRKREKEMAAKTKKEKKP